MNAKPAYFTVAQLRRQVGRRSLQRVEQLSAIHDFDPKFIVLETEPDDNLSAVLWAVAMGDNIAEYFVERHAHVVDNRGRQPVFGAKLLDQRHDRPDLGLPALDTQFPMRHSKSSRRDSQPLRDKVTGSPALVT